MDEIRSGDGSFIKMVELAFQAIRGVGQGESASSLLWVAVMDILLTMLSNDDDGPFHESCDVPPLSSQASERSDGRIDIDQSDTDEQTSGNSFPDEQSDEGPPDVILEDDDDESVSSEDERLMRGELHNVWRERNKWSQKENLVFADDLATAAHSQEEQQRKADLISAFTTFTGLEIAAGKIAAVAIFDDSMNYIGIIISTMCIPVM